MTAMTRVAVVGELVRAQGFGLAGVLVVVAGDPPAVRAAWRSLPDDVGVVILTPAAAAALAAVPPGSGGRLVAVMPP